MSMLLDDPHGVTKLDSYTYYETQLKNDKILLNQIDRAIAALSASDGIQEYTIDTGQDRQTVKRADIGTLIAQKQRLLAEINQLTESLYGSGRWSQVIPGY